MSKHIFGPLGKKREFEGGNPSELHDSSIEKHDRYNFEAKLDYHLENDIMKNQYELEMYFFVPNALQINSRTYSDKQFFADLHNYIRFKTPQMTIAGILNQENSLSPLVIINSHIDLLQNGETDPSHLSRIQYELRVLGCIVKSSLRDQFEIIIKSIETPDDFNENKQIWIEFLQNIKNLQKTLRNLERQLHIPQISTTIHDTFTFVDKFVSRQITENCASLYQKVITLDSSYPDIQDLLRDILKYEGENKTSLDSKFNIQKDTRNESFTYWDGILKKYVQNVLYLNLQPSKQKSATLEILYSFAAGIAMFLSIVLGFLIVDRFTENSSIYFGLLIVIYMLKDRFKDWIRLASNKFVQSYFPDRRFSIYDEANNNKIGICKESMRFLSMEEVPQEILNFRGQGAKSLIEHEGKPEIIFRYVKNVILDTSEIKEFHERHGDVNDIIRFNVRNFLNYADDPISKELLWNQEKQKVEQISCNKVYHLNIVFKLRPTNSKKEFHHIFYKKIRVVIDQNGIQRVSERKIVK